MLILGAPGTLPPRRLVKQVSTIFSSNGYHHNYANGAITNGEVSPPNGINPTFGAGNNGYIQGTSNSCEIVNVNY